MSTPTTKITSISTKKPEMRWIIPLLLGIIALLLLSNLYFISLFSSAGKQGNEQVTKMRVDSLNLQNIYLSALDSLNQQKTENAELNIFVDEMKEDLTKIYNEIGLKVKAGMSDEALENELRRLNTQMRNSLKEINSLKLDKIALQKKVEQIQKEKAEVISRIDTITSERNSALAAVTESDKKREEALVAAGESERQAENKIKALKGQIDAASFISVTEISISAQNQRRKKSEITTKSSKVDYYKICLKTTVNPLIEKGKQAFFLRLLSDAGEPIQIGNEETMSNGQPVRYTRSFAIEYDGTSKEQCFNWEPTQKLQPGKYVLDVFNNGKLVGQSSLILK